MSCNGNNEVILEAISKGVKTRFAQNRSSRGIGLTKIPLQIFPSPVNSGGHGPQMIELLFS